MPRLVERAAALGLPAISAFGQKGVPKDDTPVPAASPQPRQSNETDNPFASSAQSPPDSATLAEKAEYEAMTFVHMLSRLLVALILSAALAFLSDVSMGVLGERLE